MTLPDTRLESTNNQRDNDNKNHLPVVNPADFNSNGVESGKDGNMAEGGDQWKSGGIRPCG